MNQKLAIIGLDCAAPELVFDKFRQDLPTLSSLLQAGTWGRLRSATPPITVPAWASMFSGRDPGELGVYGFRNRKNYSYDSLSIATANAIKYPRLWDILGNHDLKSIVLGVPQTYPTKPLNGLLISGLLTPGQDSQFTYPDDLKSEILEQFPNYQFDVANYRQLGPERFLEQLYTMTGTRFDVAKYLTSKYPWDCFTMVEIGLDRVQHIFWHHMDQKHPLYIKDSPFKNVIRKYYQFLDRQIGQLLAAFDEHTTVVIVSDHGAQSMQGGFCLNEWLISEGYLALKSDPPEEPVELDAEMVDWNQTRAWGTGGYYGRIFLNVQDRETNGVVGENDYDELCTEIQTKLSTVQHPGGRILKNDILRPKDVYRQVNGIAPDLMVFFDDLRYRSLGSIGHDGLFSQTNDTGPDGANHAFDGIFISSDKLNPEESKEISGMQLQDFLPSVLSKLQIPFQDLDFDGKVFQI